MRTPVFPNPNQLNLFPASWPRNPPSEQCPQDPRRSPRSRNTNIPLVLTFLQTIPSGALHRSDIRGKGQRNQPRPLNIELPVRDDKVNAPEEYGNPENEKGIEGKFGISGTRKDEGG